MNERITYRLAYQGWSSEGGCILLDESGQQLMIVPVEFARRGHVDNIGYVYQQLDFCYEAASDYVIQDEAGAVLEHHEPIRAGRFTVRKRDKASGPASPAPKKGPRFKFKYRAPNYEDDYASTMSDSKRSSEGQSRFLLHIVARDPQCLVTDTLYGACTASHILPVSRPEYYTEVFGYDPHGLNDASYGLLLRDEVHHAFDRGAIAFYPKVDADGSHKLIVHILDHYDDYDQYHGKVIDVATRFRTSPFYYPNTDLLLFHYKQCAIKHFRGFSSWPAPEF